MHRRWQKVVLITLLVVGSFWLCEDVLFWGPARRARNTIMSTDHAALLVECRVMMAQMPTYTDESTAPASLRDPSQVLLCGVSPQLARDKFPVIARLDPKWITVRTNQVWLVFRGPPCRVNVRAFPPGTTGFGWKKLRDGLWMN